MMQMMMTTIIAHNNTISNVETNAQYSPQIQDEKWEELCDENHDGHISRMNMRKGMTRM